MTALWRAKANWIDGTVKKDGVPISGTYRSRDACELGNVGLLGAVCLSLQLAEAVERDTAGPGVSGSRLPVVCRQFCCRPAGQMQKSLKFQAYALTNTCSHAKTAGA